MYLHLQCFACIFICSASHVSSFAVLVIFVQFCVFVHSCCIGGLRFFPYGNLFRPRILQRLCFFCHVAEILLSRNRDQFFRSDVSFSCISFVCVPYPRLNDTLQPLLQALTSSRNHLQKLTAPQRHHLTSYCCFMPRVSNPRPARLF